MSQKLLLDYLESLGHERLGQIFSHHPVCCLFMFRMLPPFAQYIVQRLLLIDGPVPFEAEIRAWHPITQRAIQNKALWKLKQLQMIQGKDKEIWLNPVFRQGLMASLSEEADPVPSELFPDPAEAVEDHFNRTWNGVLYCVASGGKVHDRYSRTSAKSIELMIEANLLTKERNQIRITTEGFQFLMADTSEQVLTLLIQHLLSLDGEAFLNSFYIIVLLSFSSPGKFYPLLSFNAPQKTCLKTLSELGLLVMTKKGTAQGFCPTNLAKSISYTGDTPLMLTKEEGFLVLETNYKCYAYTDSPLHAAILSMVMKIKTQFPNMIYGQLCQDSLMEAFKKGITADQVIRFLNSSAHAIMRKNVPILPPTIADQIRLWEMDRNRLRAKPGYMYQQFLSEADFKKTLDEANRIGSVLYANPTSRILVVSEAGHPQIKAFVKATL